MAEIDYSQIPTEDLIALKNKDYSKVSTSTLQLVRQTAQGTFEPAPSPPPRWQKTMETVRPALEGTGAVAGGVLGSSAGPAGTVLGATGGYMAGAQVADILEQQAGLQKPGTIQEEFAKQPARLKTGAEYALGGEVLGPAAGAVVRPIGRIVGKILGGISGVGTPAMTKAFEGSSEFASGFNWAVPTKKGRITVEDVESELKQGIAIMEQDRGAVYRARSSQIYQANQQPLDIRSITSKFNSLLDDYGLQQGFTRQGGLTVVPKGISKLEKKEFGFLHQIMNDLELMKYDASLRTPYQLDQFKQKLNNFYSENKDSRAFVTSLYNEVSDLLTRSVPGYEKMTSDYAKTTRFLEELKMATGEKGAKTNVDTVFSRLTSIMTKEPEHGRALLEELNNAVGHDLNAQLSGIIMRDLLPKGGFGRYMAAGEIGAVLTGYLNAKFLVTLGACSPKIQGEFVRAFGKIYRSAGAVPALSVTGSLPALLEPSPAREEATSAAKEYIYDPVKGTLGLK